MNSFPGSEVDHEQLNRELGLPVGVALAPIWRRLVAQVIDQVVVGAPVVGFGYTIGVHISGDVSDNKLLVLNTAFVCVAFLYECVMIAMLGRTVGKMLMRTRVVRIDTGGSMPWTSSAIRALVPLATGVIPGVGVFATLAVYSVAFFDKRHQGVHDKACGSIVVLNNVPM